MGRTCPKIWLIWWIDLHRAEHKFWLMGRNRGWEGGNGGIGCIEEYIKVVIFLIRSGMNRCSANWVERTKNKMASESKSSLDGEVHVLRRRSLLDNK